MNLCSIVREAVATIWLAGSSAHSHGIRGMLFCTRMVCIACWTSPSITTIQLSGLLAERMESSSALRKAGEDPTGSNVGMSLRHTFKLLP